MAVPTASLHDFAIHAMSAKMITMSSGGTARSRSTRVSLTAVPAWEITVRKP